MPRLTRVVAGDSSVHIFKGSRNWRRDLEVILRSQPDGAARKVAFPPDQDYLRIEGLQPRSRYEVQVRRRRIWERWRHRSIAVLVDTRTQLLRVLITGSGRSGTQTLAHYLDGARFRDGQPVVARHEPLAEFTLAALLEGDRELIRCIQEGAGHNVESAPYYALFPDSIRADRVIHVVRDGRRVVQSGVNRGWYQTDTLWNRVKPDFPGDVFARCCHLWRHTNEAVEPLAQHRFRLEDLVADPAVLAEFQAAADIEPFARPLPHSNRGDRSSAYGEWTAAQRETFTEICGPLMDRFYPSWRG